MPFMRLYTFAGPEEGKIRNFTIPKAPGQVTIDKNRRGVVTLSWTAEERNDMSGFLVQYCEAKRGRWTSIRHHSETITINYLQSEAGYVFRVAAVTQGGRSPFGPAKEVTIDPVCPPPDGLRGLYETDTSLTITWKYNLEDAILFDYFSVECWANGNDSTPIQRSTTDMDFTIEPLVRDTIYRTVFK